MKICLMTVPHVKNYGAVLMCYATQKLFEQHGFDVEFVNYLRGSPEEADNFHDFYKNLTIKGYANPLLRIIYATLQLRTLKERSEIFGNFIKENLHFSPIYYGDNEEFLMQNPPEADIYCTGGDQMWNEIYNYHRTLNAFYLDFAPAGKPRVSFSTSIGKSKFDDWEIPEVLPLLQKYSLISVREDSGKKTLEGLELENIYHIQDPTLIYRREQWKELVAPRFIEEPYIFIYQLIKNKEFDRQVQKLSHLTGYKLIRLEYSCYKKHLHKGHAIVLPTPEEFLSLIKYAECIVTDSFHGTAFSINLNRPFLSVYPPKTSTRIESLLKLCNLMDRRYSGGEMLELLNNPIDYDHVNKTLEIERKKAHDYIEKIKSLVLTDSRIN